MIRGRFVGTSSVKFCAECGHKLEQPAYAMESGNKELCTRTCWEKYRAKKPSYPVGWGSSGVVS